VLFLRQRLTAAVLRVLQEPRHTPMSRSIRIACLIAAAAVLLTACSSAILVEAQKVASEIFGTWTTAALSEARAFLAATSLPNAGLAIFAGGQSGCEGDDDGALNDDFFVAARL
jgi:hypothetical protein